MKAKFGEDLRLVGSNHRRRCERHVRVRRRINRGQRPEWNYQHLRIRRHSGKRRTRVDGQRRRRIVRNIIEMAFLGRATGADQRIVMVVLCRAVVDELARRPARTAADVNRAAGCARDRADKLRRPRERERDKHIRIAQARSGGKADRIRHRACLRVAKRAEEQCRCDQERKVMRRIEKIFLGQG